MIGDDEPNEELEVLPEEEGNHLDHADFLRVCKVGNQLGFPSFVVEQSFPLTKRKTGPYPAGPCPTLLFFPSGLYTVLLYFAFEIKSVRTRFVF